MASEHLVQFYADETTFLDTLEAFTREGLSSGQAVILIATAAHLHDIESRLETQGVALDQARLEDRYLPVNAIELLSRLVFRTWPDEFLFTRAVGDLMRRAGQNGRKVRAFGEMVAILWERGQTSAVFHLEHLWNLACREHDLTLFCAYPTDVFGNEEKAIDTICGLHTQVVPA